MKLRVGHLSTTYHTALVIYGSRWKKDIEMDWRLYPTGPAMIKSMSEGAIDIAYIGLPPAMIGITRGMRIKCVAGGHVEGTLLLGRNELAAAGEGGLKKVVSQFKGSIIGAPAWGSIHDVIVRDLLMRNGLEEKVEVKNYPWSDQIVAALEDGEIDAAVGTPSMAGVVLEAGLGKILVPPWMLWPFNPSYGIVAREELIRSHPSRIKSFLRLHRKASRLIRESPKDAARIVARVLEVVDEEFVLKVYSLSPRYCISLPRRFIETTMAFVPVLQRMGYINRSVREEEVFHLEFIQDIHPEDPHY
jgi:NitT/TauT family transport system substrate-binding protein